MYRLDREEKVRIERFFNHYKRFVNTNMDPEKYKKILNGVHKITDGIDFNSNLIICYPKVIDKEVYLSGFSRLDSYKTFHYLSMGDLKGIFFSYNWDGGDADAKTPIGGVNSTNQLNNDVLCLTANIYESKPKSGFLVDICLEVIMRRAFDNSNKLNWIFYRGSVDSLRLYYDDLYKAFRDNSHNNFSIVDISNHKPVYTNFGKRDTKLYSDFAL